MTPSEQLWLTFASILASFDIQKARDASGKEIAINDEYIAFGHLQWAAYSTTLASLALTCIFSPASRNLLNVQSNPGLVNIVS